MWKEALPFLWRGEPRQDAVPSPRVPACAACLTEAVSLRRWPQPRVPSSPVCRAAPGAGHEGRGRAPPLRRGAEPRHGLAPPGPARRPSRRRLGLDDCCWLLPRHHLHQGRDEVQALLLVLLASLWHWLFFFFCLGRGFVISDVLQLTGLFWLAPDSLLLLFPRLPETPKAAGATKGLEPSGFSLASSDSCSSFQHPLLDFLQNQGLGQVELFQAWLGREESCRVSLGSLCPSDPTAMLTFCQSQ